VPALGLDFDRSLNALPSDVRRVIGDALREAGFQVEAEQLTRIETRRACRLPGGASMFIRTPPIRAQFEITPRAGGCAVAAHLEGQHVNLAGKAGRWQGTCRRLFGEVQESVDRGLAGLDPSAAGSFFPPRFWSRRGEAAAFEQAKTLGARAGGSVVDETADHLDGGSEPRSPEAASEHRVARPMGTSAWPFRTKIGPLGLSPQRVRLWWFALAVVGLLPIVSALSNNWNDWSAFWAAGGTVGSASLMDSRLHTAWQVAHGLPGDYWRYPPAFAYLYWPASLLPVGLGFAINAGLMLALVVFAGLLLSRIFGLPRNVIVPFALAWTPALAPVDMGQNTPLAVVLALWAIDALRRDSQLEAGLAGGLLMYKPELGLPLLGFLMLRSRWRSVSIASLVIAAGYVLSVAAAAGDWLWPVAWWNGIKPWLAHDLIFNADKTISLPGLIGRIPGVPWWLPFLGGAAVVLLALRGLIRASVVEAASAVCLLTLVAGPRVWSYEAGLMLPIVAWSMAGGLSEPWRTRLVLLAVSMSILWVVSPLTLVSGVAVITNAAMVMWLWRWRPFGSELLVGESAARA